MENIEELKRLAGSGEIENPIICGIYGYNSHDEYPYYCKIFVMLPANDFKLVNRKYTNYNWKIFNEPVTKYRGIYCEEFNARVIKKIVSTKSWNELSLNVRDEMKELRIAIEAIITENETAMKNIPESFVIDIR